MILYTTSILEEQNAFATHKLNMWCPSQTSKDPKLLPIGSRGIVVLQCGSMCRSTSASHSISMPNMEFNVGVADLDVT
jgi:hypothetical protein